MRKSHLLRAALTGLVLSNLCLAHESTPVDGFRSELWRMEYREQEEKTRQIDEDDEDAGDTTPKTPLPTVQRRVDEDIVSLAVANDSLEVSAPGQVDYQELSDQTPFADWKVDEGAMASDGHRKFRRATAYQLSQTGNDDEASVPMSNGPSMVTFMVAIVACVVVTGALFSGRD